MEFIYLLGFLLHFFFGSYFCIFSVYCMKEDRLTRVFMLFLLIGVSFFILSFFYFMWGFGYLDFSLLDFSLMSSLLVFFRILLLLVILSYVYHNNRVLLYLFAYVLLLVPFFFSVSLTFMLLVISFVVLLLISLSLYSRKEFESVGILGLFYVVMSTILFLIMYVGVGDVVFLTLSLNILFFLFLFEFVYVIRYNSDIIVRYGYFQKVNSVYFDFFKYFVFVLVLVNFVFIATVAFHEIGHFGSAKFFGCGYSRIVYESGLPHTELLCGTNDLVNYSMTLISGILFPIVLSFFFFFSGGQFIRELGLLVVGFNLLISYQDYLDLGFSSAFSLFLSILGLICVILALGYLISSRAQEQRFLDFTEGHKNFNRRKRKS